MNYKNTLLTIAFIMAIENLQAQPPGGKSPAERAKTEATALKTELSLTDEQYQKVYDIMTTHNPKGKPSQNASEDEREAMRTQMEAERTEQETKIKTLLTDAQKNKYDNYLANRQKEMSNRRNANHSK